MGLTRNISSATAHATTTRRRPLLLVAGFNNIENGDVNWPGEHEEYVQAIGGASGTVTGMRDAILSNLPQPSDI